jgi:AcrR family transcriptional regulator
MTHIRDEVEFNKKRQQIMVAALAVFAEKGYEKATCKDIAQAAGIGSPGLIYHYFEGKTDLLRQTVAAQMPGIWVLGREDALAGLAPREALTLVANSFLTAMANPSAVALFRVMLSEALRRPEVGAVWSSIVAGPRFLALHRYLARQIDSGALRPMDAGAATRCFVGPLLLYFLTNEVIPVHDSQYLSPDTLVKTAVEVFLRGTTL